jgi:hypothetical protein
MQQPTPKERLRAYRQWRMRTASAIRELDDWLELHHYATPETRAGIEAALASMQTDRPILTSLLQTKHQADIGIQASGVRHLLDHHRANIAARMERAKIRLAKLDRCRDKYRGLIAEMLDRTRREQELYLRAVQRCQEGQARLTLVAQRCRDILDPSKMDALTAQVRSDMARTWTTAGMGTAMKGLFVELVRAMQAVSTEAEHARQVVRELYSGFERDFGFALAPPRVFVPRDFRVEMDLLHQEVDAFRRSPTLAFAERGVVIKRFDDDMVTRARSLVEQLRAAFDTWERDTLGPLARRIQEHASATERRLEKLQRLGRSYDDTRRHLEDTQAHYAELARQLTALRNIHNTLNCDPAPEQPLGPDRRLAGQGA